jgi:cytochrome c556
MTRWIFLVGGLAVLCVPMAGSSQPARPAPPKLEPVAETKLLMEGLALPNFKGIDRLLKTEPADVDAWKFARGQSLLMAETANLLMIRPPKGSEAEERWMSQATSLRDTASKLARNLAARDYAKSRQAMDAVAATCNRCHQTFRIETRIQPTEAGK